MQLECRQRDGALNPKNPKPYTWASTHKLSTPLLHPGTLRPLSPKPNLITLKNLETSKPPPSPQVDIQDVVWQPALPRQRSPGFEPGGCVPLGLGVSEGFGSRIWRVQGLVQGLE